MAYLTRACACLQLKGMKAYERPLQNMVAQIERVRQRDSRAPVGHNNLLVIIKRIEVMVRARCV